MNLQDSLPTHAKQAQFETQAAPENTSMGIVGLTVRIPSTSRPTQDAGKSQPARWNTMEFKIYYVVACIVIPIMVWIPVSLSSPTHPNYPLFRSRLSNGWIFNRPIDNSDAQYRSFRNNIPILIVVASLYLFSKYIKTLIAPDNSGNKLHTIPFSVFFSVIMLLALHGSSLLKIALILIVNYCIAKWCRGSKLGPVLTWVFNGLVLLANERYDGYRFGDMLSGLAFLDSFEGIHPRWHIGFNISMLRLVSYNLDYYWACNHKERTDADTIALNEKQRQSSVHSEEMYSFMNYISYLLYPPLYFAGPIITFNDFLWQHRRPLSLTSKSKFNYAIRFIINFLVMELILHFMYVVAIKDKKAWMGDTPGQISMIGFWNLMVVWLKLLIPWRFFRLWALLDGIDPPENMVRCMANNYSPLGFWRSWHRSYNLWIIRYIYIPLGGTNNALLNTVLVFSFVALWHDLTFCLLAWGWLVSLFIIPELAARHFFPASKYASKSWYRHVCAVGAVLNILMMMVANLVGFVIGTDGIKFFISQLFGSLHGIPFLLGVFGCLFVGVQLMFEYREEEMRKGIYRRC